MGSKSNYLEEKWLNHILRGTAYTAPGTAYIALFTAAPSDSGGGTEVGTGAYARVVLNSTAASWNAPGTSGTIDNASAITFAVATANWGTVVAFGLFDTLSGGSLLYWGTLDTNKSVDNGDTAQFNAGSLDISED